MNSSLVIFMQCMAILSCCSSLFILIIFLKYPELSKFELSRLVKMICFCDLFGSIGMAFGHPHDGSALCIFQAILTNIFPIAGVFWTTLMAYLLLIHLFQFTSMEKFSYFITFLCYFIPTLVTFLPLTTNTFGLDSHSTGWCFLKDRSDSPSWSLIFWTALSFYLWMWGGMILYLIFSSLVIYKLYLIFIHNPNHSNRKTLLQILVYFLFPFNFLLCWSPATLFDFFRTSGYNSYPGHLFLSNLSDITPTFLGLANALTCVLINEQIRRKIWLFLHGYRDESDDDDVPIRVVFQEEQEQQQRESEMIRRNHEKNMEGMGNGGDDLTGENDEHL